MPEIFGKIYHFRPVIIHIARSKIDSRSVYPRYQFVRPLGFCNDITNPMVAVFRNILMISNFESSMVQFAFYGGC